jgi:fructokinase
MNQKPLIAGIGEILWDVLPTGKQLGGAPCNFAFHAIQAGCEGFVIGAVGKDDLGDELKKKIIELDMSVKYIQVNEFPTGTVSVRVDEKGHPDYTINENVAWDHIRWNSGMEDLAKKLDAVCFGSLAQRDMESGHSILSFISALRKDCLKVFDINLRKTYYTKEILLNSLTLTDVLKLNDEELPIIADFFGFDGSSEKQLDQLLKFFNLKYVIYTMGSKGSLIKSNNELSFSDAPFVQIEDTVGAGDSFTAVFTSGILKGIPLTKIHRKASEIAAYVCTQKGATPKIIQTIF